MGRHALTDSLVEHYRNEGYVVVNSVFDRQDLASVELAIQELTQRASTLR